MYKVVKLQLHTGMEGYDSPEAFATYKSTGGKPLGVVGRVFEPADLELLDKSFQESLSSCGGIYSDVVFKEQRDGARCQFEVTLPKREIESPMVGDTIQQRLILRTGFDGLTKTSLSFQSYRLWCKNGAASWVSDVVLSVKNTLNNHVKLMMFCDEIYEVLKQADDYVQQLNAAVKRPITQQELDEFLTKLTGYSVKDYQELTTKRRNILDKINQSVAIEASNTGWNQYSVLQGVSRYVTHDLCGGDPFHDALYYDNAGDINRRAHRLLLS
jgi:hypothetical protein